MHALNSILALRSGALPIALVERMKPVVTMWKDEHVSQRMSFPEDRPAGSRETSSVVSSKVHELIGCATILCRSWPLHDDSSHKADRPNSSLLPLLPNLSSVYLWRNASRSLLTNYVTDKLLTNVASRIGVSTTSC